MTKEWTISIDREIWDKVKFFETKEDAIQYGKKNLDRLLKNAGREEFADKKTIYVAQAIPFYPYVSVHNLINIIQKQAHEYSGEKAEGYLSGVSEEAVDELGNSLNAQFVDWMEKHNQQPNFHQIRNVEEVTF